MSVVNSDSDGIAPSINPEAKLEFEYIMTEAYPQLDKDLLDGTRGACGVSEPVIVSNKAIFHIEHRNSIPYQLSDAKLAAILQTHDAKVYTNFDEHSSTRCARLIVVDIRPMKKYRLVYWFVLIVTMILLALVAMYAKLNHLAHFTKLVGFGQTADTYMGDAYQLRPNGRTDDL